MEYAVIQTGGKQYKVKKGQIIDVENLDQAKNGSLIIDKVLLYVKDSDIKIGKPYIANIKVKAKTIDNLRGKKIRVARFAAKVRHRRAIGFRSSITRLLIEEITASK
jgi:large subunit ribosomal protein L21